MTQETVLKFRANSDKCRTMALKIAAAIPGVIRVTILGKDRDHLEVIGNGVDPVGLTKALRKKLGFADIIKVEQVVESKCVSGEFERPTPIQYCATTSSYGQYQQPQICVSGEFERPTPIQCCASAPSYNQFQPPPPPQICYPMYYHEQPTYEDSCSIM